MKKTMIFLSILFILSGCTKSGINSTANNDVTEKNLLQSALLNEITLQYYSFDTNFSDKLELSEPFYFENISSEYYAFSMVDINFDGQKDVCLYSTIYEEQFLRVLFIENGRVYVSGINTDGCEITKDGYAVAETEKMFLAQKSIMGRGNVDVLKIMYDSEIYQYNGVDISLEEAEKYKDDFSRELPNKYEINESNILKFVK